MKYAILSRKFNFYLNLSIQFFLSMNNNIENIIFELISQNMKIYNNTMNIIKINHKQIHNQTINQLFIMHLYWNHNK